MNRMLKIFLIGIGVYSGFFVSFFTMNLFGGTLQDQNGVENILGINANLFVFIPLFILLCIGAVFAFSSDEDKNKGGFFPPSYLGL